MLRRSSPAWFLVPALVIVGCEKDEALVVLRPVGGRVERTLTLQRVDRGAADGTAAPKFGAVAAEVLTGPLACYGAEQPSPRPGVHVFRRAYAGRLPDDLGGGFGSYVCRSTELGASSAYLERFRGADSVLSIIAAQSAAVDHAIDDFASWLRPWLDGYAQGARVVAFVEGGLRQDFKSLATTLWLSPGTFRFNLGSDAARAYGAEALARLAQLLLERDYLDLEDLPALTTHRGGKNALEQPTPGWLRGMLARKAKITDVRTLGRLRELFDSPAAMASLEVHLEKRCGTDKAPAGSPFKHLFSSAVGVTLMGADAGDVTVELVLPVEPLATNGTWDAAAGRVSWSFPLPAKVTAKSQLAQFCRATWVTPDTARQRTLFGRVVLTGERLASYCTWRSSLPRQRAAEWSAFLAGLSPGPDLGRHLRRFAFSDGRPDKALAQVIEWLAE